MSVAIKTPNEFTRMPPRERHAYLLRLGQDYQQICDDALRLPNTPILPYSPGQATRSGAYVNYQGLKTLLETACSDTEPDIRGLANRLFTDVSLYAQTASGQFGAK